MEQIKKDWKEQLADFHKALEERQRKMWIEFQDAMITALLEE